MVRSKSGLFVASSRIRRRIVVVFTAITVIAPVVAVPPSTAVAHDSEVDIAITGPPETETENAPIETDFDPNDPEVTWYAKRHKISAERSLQIANWMTEVSPLIEGLKERMPRNYAEVRVVHGGEMGDRSMPAGDIRVELRVVNPDAPEVVALVDDINRVNSRIGRVATQVIEVPKSLVQLETEAMILRQEQNIFDREIEFDFDRGTLAIGEVAQVPIKTNHDCQSFDSKKFDSGRAVFLDADGGGCNYAAACTAGLGAFLSGRYGLTTAGHCFTEGAGWPQGLVPNFLNHVADVQYIFSNETYASGFPYYSDDGSDDDAAFFARRFNNTEVTARIWKYGANEWRLTTHHEWSARPLGLTICLSASKSSQNGEGTYCAEVIDEYANAGNPFLQRWTKVDFREGRFPSGNGPGQGSSGSPAFWGNTAYGTMTGCDTIPACHIGWIYQVRYLHAALKAHNSDAKMLCATNGTNMGVKCEPS